MITCLKIKRYLLVSAVRLIVSAGFESPLSVQQVPTKPDQKQSETVEASVWKCKPHRSKFILFLMPSFMKPNHQLVFAEIVSNHVFVKGQVKSE